MNSQYNSNYQKFYSAISRKLLLRISYKSLIDLFFILERFLTVFYSQIFCRIALLIPLSNVLRRKCSSKKEDISHSVSVSVLKLRNRNNDFAILIFVLGYLMSKAIPKRTKLIFSVLRRKQYDESFSQLENLQTKGIIILGRIL